MRRDRQYAAIQETLTQLRAQSGRIKETLEQCMAQGQTLSPADLQGLLCLPLGRSLLERLILLTGDGDFRLLEPGAGLPAGDAPGSSLPPLPGRPAQRLAAAGAAAAWCSRSSRPSASCTS